MSVPLGIATTVLLIFGASTVVAEMRVRWGRIGLVLSLLAIMALVVGLGGMWQEVLHD